MAAMPEENDNEDDPFDLTRFARAQEPVYETALAELRSGEKRSHWIWYIFPQFAGLGRSPTAERYAIRSRAEAEAYARHPLLGARLRECTAAVNAVEGRSAQEIFSTPDWMKFRSSMTLFAHTAEPGEMFAAALAKYYGGEECTETLRLLFGS